MPSKSKHIGDIDLSVLIVLLPQQTAGEGKEVRENKKKKRKKRKRKKGRNL